MGASCTPCDCFGGQDLKNPGDSDDSSSSGSDTETDEERLPLKKRKKGKKKHHGKKKKHHRKKKKRDQKKKRKHEENVSQSKDESYFTPSDDDDSEYAQKKKKNKDDKLVAEIQQQLINNDGAQKQMSNQNDSGNLGVLYGMDTKTMELLLNVGDLSNPSPVNRPPEPSMPTIISAPITSINEYEYQDNVLNNMNNMADIQRADDRSPSDISGRHDMRLQLESYNSNIMYGGNGSGVNTEDNTPISQSSRLYDALTVEDEDDNTTPALPGNDNNNKKKDLLTITANKHVGGVDYDDFEEEQESLEPLNAIRREEKNITDERIKTLQQISRGQEEIDKLITEQYAMPDEEEEDDTDSESYAEDEKLEIEKRKTEVFNAQKKDEKKTNNVSKAKLFRPGTNTMWEAEEMNDMELAMKKELEEMKRANSNDVLLNNNNKSNNNMDSIHVENKIIDTTTSDDDLTTSDDDEETDKEIHIALKAGDNITKTLPRNDSKKQSALFRHKSAYKWDTDELEQQNKEMRDQLAHLLKEHQTSIETDSIKQPQISQPTNLQ